AQLAGVDTSTGPCLSDVLTGDATAIDALRTGPAGLQILANRWAGDFTNHSPRMLDRLFHELQSLDEHADILVVDAGSGMNHARRRFWQGAGLILLVTAPDDMAVMDAYATLKSVPAGDLAAEVRVLVNHCDAATLADDVHRRIAGACQR